MEILETFPWVFCFPKSRINKNGGKTYTMIVEKSLLDKKYLKIKKIGRHVFIVYMSN